MISARSTGFAPLPASQLRLTPLEDSPHGLGRTHASLFGGAAPISLGTLARAGTVATSSSVRRSNLRLGSPNLDGPKLAELEPGLQQS